jgi:release factor glutamine methyltransferase
VTAWNVSERLSYAGCVAPDEEADELVDASGGDPDRLEALLRRRESGEPLGWVVGSVPFGPDRIRVEPGVYVPREQTRILVAAAAEVLPAGGTAVDLCTGSGAVAVALRSARPAARVVGTDIDPVACRCARANGVEVFSGDLDEGLPPSLVGAVEVVTAVAPYVPTAAIPFLPRDSREHEPLRALDGGPDGTSVLVRVVEAAARLLRPGGSVVVEVGAGQDERLEPVLQRCGFGPAETYTDDDGDLRLLRATLR